MRPWILTALALTCWAAGGEARAQDAAALDCGLARTATEVAICGSPRLARLQNIAAEAYRDLFERVGPRQARPLAREQLALRDACGADAACIEARLVAAVGIFQSGSADVGPGLAGLPGVETTPLGPALGESEPLALAPPDPAQLEAVPTGPDGALILPVVLEAPSGWLGAIPPEERLALGAPQLVPGPGRLLRPPPPLEAAFGDLPEERRRAVQARLALAGFGGEADGAWGPITEGALAQAAAEAAGFGRSFDLLTPDGARALVDYVESFDFDIELGG